MLLWSIYMKYIRNITTFISMLHLYIKAPHEQHTSVYAKKSVLELMQQMQFALLHFFSLRTRVCHTKPHCLLVFLPDQELLSVRYRWWADGILDRRPAADDTHEPKHRRPASVR